MAVTPDYLQHGVQMHLFAFICGSSEGDFNASDHKALNDRMASEHELQTMLQAGIEVVSKFLLHAVMNLRAWQKVRNFFTKWVNINFSRALLYGARHIHSVSSSYGTWREVFPWTSALLWIVFANSVSRRATSPRFDCETNETYQRCHL